MVKSEIRYKALLDITQRYDKLIILQSISETFYDEP